MELLLRFIEKVKKSFRVGILLVMLIFQYSPRTWAQSGLCSSTTPFFKIDLTGRPMGFDTIPSSSRVGSCCGSKSQFQCVEIEVKIDTNSVGIVLEVAGGAKPGGSLYYQVNCGPHTSVGVPLCLTGTGPHTVTFCKPGNNTNTFQVRSLPKAAIPQVDEVTIGCELKIGMIGMVDSSLLWTDITSNNNKYISYLSCTIACDSVIVTPDSAAPTYVDYQICGKPDYPFCQNIPDPYCDTVRIYFKRIVDSIAAVICDGEQYELPDNQIVNQTGWYSSILTSSDGCDSTVVVFLQVNPVPKVSQLAFGCDSATVNGNWYYNTQIVTDTFTTSLGCDSFVLTDLTIYPSYYNNFSAIGCDSAFINGNWYFTTQTITDNFTTINGCDSIIVTDLTVNNSVITNQSLTDCDSCKVNGNWYYNSQIVRDYFRTFDGCDSLVITDLTINHSIFQSFYVEVCNDTVINRRSYKGSQIIRDTFQTIHGCDSIVYMSLVVYKPDRTYLNMTVCDSVQIGRRWYYESMLAFDTLSDATSICDSILVINLTVNKTKYTHESMHSCDSAVIHGNWYYKSQMVIDSFTSYLGCDSIVFTDLTISNPLIFYTSMTACDYVDIRGNRYYESQEVRDSFIAVQGCDSVMITNLVIHNTQTSYNRLVSCDSAYFNDQWYFETQFARTVHMSNAGCDSIAYTNIIINNAAHTDQEIISCDSAIINGNWYYNTQVVTDVFPLPRGCDSTVVTNLTINKSTFESQVLEVCANDSIALPSGKFTNVAGIYDEHFTTITGCDSFIRSQVIVKELLDFDPVPDDSLCEQDDYWINVEDYGAELYEWENGYTRPRRMIDSAGIFTVKLTNENKCVQYDTVVIHDKLCPNCSIFIPNAFTPNDDDINGNFNAITICQYDHYHLKILNRWGEIIFDSYEPNKGWDGEFGGELVQSGVYIYVLDYMIDEGRSTGRMRGTVTLLY
jgi:gliding motility-associated-like protein